MVYSLVVRARGLEYGGLELESRSLHLKPETKLREEWGFLVVERVLRPYCWPSYCRALNPHKQEQKVTADFSVTITFFLESNELLVTFRTKVIITVINYFSPVSLKTCV